MIQVYTGQGKGKTTAGLGLVLRAAGAGKKICIIQFLKPTRPKTSEVKALKKFLGRVRVKSYGRPGFIIGKKTEEDVRLAGQAWFDAKKTIKGDYDVVMLDEINVAMDLGLLSIGEVAGYLKKVPKNKEIVLTGRNAPKIIIKIADLVTEMKEIKHYFKKSVKFRKGIEN